MGGRLEEVPLEDVRLICQHIWPRLEFKTWGDCLEKLAKNKMYANETVMAWVQSGSKDPSIFSKEILQVKPEKSSEKKDSDFGEKESNGELKLRSNATGFSEEKGLEAEQQGTSFSTSNGITQMALDSPKPTSDLISPDPIIKKKQRVLIQEAEEDGDEGALLRTPADVTHLRPRRSRSSMLKSWLNIWRIWALESQGKDR